MGHRIATYVFNLEGGLPNKQINRLQEIKGLFFGENIGLVLKKRLLILFFI